MNFKEYKKELMKDPEFVKAYEDLQPEMDIVKAILDARIKQNLSQKELSKLTGINQSEISKLESGERNPSIKLLQRLADGMGLTLKISFVPKTQA
jgi:transcriptional regulator with XRE-family HTH domain